ncbi:MAG: hypothetical protein ACREMY_10275 [bacterium]
MIKYETSTCNLRAKRSASYSLQMRSTFVASRQTRIDRERSGTRIRVDHVEHPTDPNRTFMITRQVPVDAPDESPKIIVE